jgi:hypothetical protein
MKSPFNKPFGSRSPFGPQSGVSVPVLTLVEDGLEEAIPFYTFSSTASGTLRWDFHTSATPPSAGSGDLGTGTQAISSGTTVFSIDLSPYPGTGYLHFRVTNGGGTSNILTSQVITVSSGWLPTDLGADLLAWYDVSDSGSFTNDGGGLISQWNDLSGNAMHLTTSGAARPTYGATSFNTSYPGLLFSGSQTLNKSSFGGTAGAVLSVFMVGQMNSGTEAFGRAISYSTGGSDHTGTNIAALILRDNSNNNVQSYRNSGAMSTKAITAATPCSIFSIYDGTNHTMYVNNSASGTPVASTANFTATGVLLKIGEDANLNSWNGHIVEVIVAKTAPDSTLRTTIQDYLAAKWGL